MDYLTKQLLSLVKKQLNDRLKELGQEEKVLSPKTSDDNDDPLMMNGKTSSKSPSVQLTLPSGPANVIPPKPKSKIQPKLRSPAAAAAAAEEERKKKKRRYIYAPSTIEILEASSSPTSIFLYSSMQLPRGCLAEYDGCDDGELVARAMRCQEILELSQQVTCKDTQNASL